MKSGTCASYFSCVCVFMCFSVFFFVFLPTGLSSSIHLKLVLLSLTLAPSRQNRTASTRAREKGAVRICEGCDTLLRESDLAEEKGTSSKSSASRRTKGEIEATECKQQKS